MRCGYEGSRELRSKGKPGLNLEDVAGPRTTRLSRAGRRGVPIIIAARFPCRVVPSQRAPPGLAMSLGWCVVSVVSLRVFIDLLDGPFLGDEVGIRTQRPMRPT